MKNVHDMLSAISNMSASDLDKVIRAVNIRRSHLTEMKVAAFAVGDNVKFDRGARRGGMCTGRITKINKKSVAVDVGGMMWRVSPSFLKSA